MALAAASRNGAGPSTPPSGVSVNAVSVSATGGYITTASTSTIVQIVSRCIVARSCAIGTASTTSAIPAAKALVAKDSTPAGVVRCPTPTATTPGAMTSTSPPSNHGSCG